MDANTLFVGMIAGAFGTGYFIYGKKQQKPVPMVCGVLLAVYPYFTDNVWVLLGVGLALCLAPVFIKT